MVPSSIATLNTKRSKLRGGSPPSGGGGGDFATSPSPQQMAVAESWAKAPISSPPYAATASAHIRSSSPADAGAEAEVGEASLPWDSSPLVQPTPMSAKIAIGKSVAFATTTIQHPGT